VKELRWAAACFLAFAVAGCAPWDKYAAGQGHKYTGSPLFQMYEEWGTPVSRTRLITGGRFYQFRKPATDCMASVWANDLDVVVRLTVSGSSTCAAGS
jgi:hypothetical protein